MKIETTVIQFSPIKGYIWKHVKFLFNRYTRNDIHTHTRVRVYRDGKKHNDYETRADTINP